MNTCSHIFVATLLTFWLTGSTQAALITQNFNYGASETDWSENLNIAQINLSPGGVLNSVTIVETVDWTASLSGVNVDPVASVKITKDQAELQLYDSITGANTPLFDKAIGYSNHTGITLAHGGSHNFGGFTSTDSYTYHYTAGIDVAHFLGSGFVPLEIDTFTQNVLSTSGGGRFVSTQSTEADLRVQVTYDYTGTLAVPEPSTGILFAVGSLAFLIRRRKEFAGP